jgi:Ca2+-binding RTX toxin-like protein
MTTENTDIATEGLPEELKKAIELACNSISIADLVSGKINWAVKIAKYTGTATSATDITLKYDEEEKKLIAAVAGEVVKEFMMSAGTRLVLKQAVIEATALALADSPAPGPGDVVGAIVGMGTAVFGYMTLNSAAKLAQAETEAYFFEVFSEKDATLHTDEGAIVTRNNETVTLANNSEYAGETLPLIFQIDDIRKINYQNETYNVADSTNNLLIRNSVYTIPSVSFLLSHILIVTGEQLDVGDQGLYTVQSGDTMSEIAEAYGMTTQKLLQLNTWLIDEGRVSFDQDKVLVSASVSDLTNQSHILTGSENDDRLIDRNGGRDILLGYGGDDYIEGGEGRDIMDGGADNDTFYIEGTDTEFDFFTGGSGEDTILGSIGDDTIRVHEFSGGDTVEIIDGNGGEDIIAGTDMADTIDLSGTTVRGIKEIRGGENGDTITGSAGNDNIYGEGGTDTLSGGGGVDHLYGGTGKDTYVVGEGTVYITDEDLDGVITDTAGNVLGGTWTKTDDGYLHDETGAQATLSGTVFTITLSNGGTAVINDFEDGCLGIRLGEEAPDVSDPAITGSTIEGDYALKEFYDDEGDLYYKKDSLGNYIVDTDTPEPGRDDELVDSTGNDELFGYGGVDHLHGMAGGNNVLDGGTGDDWIEDGTGDSIVIGGEDTDALFGGAGTDTIYADGKLSHDDMLTAYETNGATGEKGDLLSGEDGDDLLYGWDGDDALVGGSGDDVLYGGAGDDTIEGDLTLKWHWAGSPWTLTRTVTTENNVTYYNRIYGGGIYGVETDPEEQGDDTIFGGSGNDWIFGGYGSDTLDGGTDDDMIFGEQGDDTIFGGEGNDSLSGDRSGITAEDQGKDIIFGGDGDDAIWGGEKDDILSGGAGDDEIRGDYAFGSTNGADFIYGDDGADTITGGGNADIIDGGEGNDQIWGDGSGSTEDEVFHGSDYITGGSGDDTIVGGGDADILLGGDGNDSIWGDKSTAEQDSLYNGDDFLDGGAGDDTLMGGGGSDYVTGDSGDDVIWGDASLDYLSGEQHGDDTLTGGAGEDQIVGGGGDDTIDGGTENDLLWGDEAGEAQDGTIHGKDSIDGGEGDDVITGGGNDDILSGGDGDDEIWGDNDVDKLAVEYHGNDIINGGAGNDIIIAGAGDDTVYGNEDNDEIWGDSGADTIYGGDGDDLLYGGAGDDHLYGGAGDDLLVAGQGNDTMDGGLGDDIYHFILGSGAKHITDAGGNDRLIFQSGITSGMVSLSLGSLMISTGTEGDEIHLDGVDYDNLAETSPIDVIEFSDGETMTVAELIELKGIDIASTEEDDLLTGTSGRDNINGLAGDDVVEAKAGNDIIDLGAGNDTVFAGEGNDTVTGNTGDDVIYGEAGDDQLSGGEGADILEGGEGNDTLEGNAGVDTLKGGAGDDTFLVRSTEDTVVESADEGNDTVISDIDYTLTDNVENLELARDAAAVSGTGNSLDNTITGNSLDNTLDGMAGADTMAGGAGNDTYRVDETGDTVVEVADQGTDKVVSDIDYTLGDHVENLELSENSTAAAGTGNSQDNVITGNSQDNTLDGMAGADTMAGGTGDDTYLVDETGDTVVELADEGTDKVISDIDYTLGGHVENLELSENATAAAGTGNSLDNVITGNSQDNVISGLDGNDTLNGGAGSDTLDGGTGADTMAGGTGNDLYLVDDAADLIVESAGEGTDHVRTSVDYTLSANVENLTLLEGATQGTGNGLANVITGNDADNLLDGLGGADTLAGGMGNDTYRVDATADTVVEEDGQGTDTVQASADYTLAANVENLTLTGTSSISGTGNDLSNVITGNTGSNTLNGGAGDDLLLGGDGADRLAGGTGTDILEGGAGNDTYVMDSFEDTIVETTGEGSDTVEAAISYTLGAELENLTLTGDQDLNATGNDLNNVLIGNSGNNTLDGGTGSDAMAGGTGNDTYLTDDPGDYIYEYEDGGTDTEIRYHDSDYLLAGNVENLILEGAVYRGNGNELDNVISGNDAENNLWGREGDDSLYGRGGDDQLIGDTGADHLEGGDGNDLMAGGEGNDTMLGGTGDDQLNGGSGFNTLEGGAGSDIYVYGNDGGIYEIDNSGGGTDWLLFSDEITAERLSYIQEGDDLIVRVDEDETRQVRVINWFLGEDYQIDYIQPGGGTGIPASDINDMVAGNGSDFDSIQDGTDGGEQLVGTSGADQINGLAGDDQLFGLAGNDELNGGEGDDYLDGGAGNDVQNGGDGADQLGGDAGNDTLAGGAGNDIYVYRPGSGADTIINGDGGTDWLIFTDDITSDRLTYLQSGDDLIIRVDGDEASQVTVTNWFLGDDYQLSFVQPSGESAVTAAQINTLFSTTDPGTGDGLEVPDESTFDSVVTGTAAGEQVVGSSGSNLLKGLEGDDQLFGLAGDDWLLGGDGADYFDGGTGSDTMLGGAGNDQLGGDAGDDILVGGTGDDTYVYRPGSGADTIINGDGGTDWLLFTDDITEDRLTYVQSGEDLQVRIDGSTDTMVTIQGWFADDANKVAYIQPSGGYGIPAATIETMVQEEPVAAATAVSGSTLIDTASALELTGSDTDYSTFSKNAGLYLSDTEDIGVSDDLTTLAQTDDEMNTSLLAAV